MRAADGRLLVALLDGQVPPGAVAPLDADDLGGLLYAQGHGDACYAAIHLQTAADNLRHLCAVARICDDLSATGAEPLVLPGAALLRLYPDLGCRPMDDIDLLAPPGKREQVVQALVAHGWEAPPRHPNLFTRSDGCTIDLHTDLLNGDRLSARRRAGWIDPGLAWSRRRRRDVAGFSFLTLSDEDELLITTAHALRHSYRRLIWLVDLGLQLRQPGIDAEHLGSHAMATALEKPLTYALVLLNTADVALPPWAVRWCIQQEPGTLVSTALLWIHRHRRETVAGEILGCWTCRRISDRFRLLAEFVFPGRAVLLQVFPRLPHVLAPLAYPLRLLQIVWRGVAEFALAALRR